MIIGTAHRATQAQARRAFEAGKAVLVTDHDLQRAEVPVSERTTVHVSVNNHDNGTTWAVLRSQMLAWGRRQQMYIVTYTPEHLHELHIQALLVQGGTREMWERTIASAKAWEAAHPYDRTKDIEASMGN